MTGNVVAVGGTEVFVTVAIIVGGIRVFVTVTGGGRVGIGVPVTVGVAVTIGGVVGVFVLVAVAITVDVAVATGPVVSVATGVLTTLVGVEEAVAVGIPEPPGSLPQTSAPPK